MKQTMILRGYLILRRLWQDRRGFVNSTDVILLTTILGLGMIVGLVVLRNQVVQEFTDVGTAIGFLNQSYEYERSDSDNATLDPGGTWLGTHWAEGSSYTDETDVGDVADTAGSEPGEIDISAPAPVLDNATPGEN